MDALIHDLHVCGWMLSRHLWSSQLKDMIKQLE